MQHKANKTVRSNVRVSSSGSINPLFMNFFFNGMGNLIHENILEYKKVVFKCYINHFPNSKIASSVKYKPADWDCKKLQTSCRFFKYANDFIILSSSNKFLTLIKKKIYFYFYERGLQLHPAKKKTILFKSNTPFEFLGYTFICLV